MDTLGCRCADLNDWESGREDNIEKHGNRFADSDGFLGRIGETTWTTRDNLLAGIGRTTPSD